MHNFSAQFEFSVRFDAQGIVKTEQMKNLKKVSEQIHKISKFGEYDLRKPINGGSE